MPFVPLWLPLNRASVTSVRSPFWLRGHKLTAIVDAIEEDAFVCSAIAGGYNGDPAKLFAPLYIILLLFLCKAKMIQIHRMI